MKKITFTVALFVCALSINAQSDANNAFLAGSKTPIYVQNPERTVGNPDTTGIVNYTDFLPEFLPNGGAASIYGYTGGGFIFGNNVSTNNLRICAQGYKNLNPTPVSVVGVLAWFGGKQSDAGSSATSKVTFSLYNMAVNKAYNTNGSGTFNSTTANWPGPNGTAVASGDLLFADVDTVDFNYVPFTTAGVCYGDFAVAMDVTPLAAGDTVGLVSDRQNDAQELDYAFHKIGTKWYVTDQLFSAAASPTFGTGGLDNNIAMWLVLSEYTAVNEYFNGIKLTAYPNPTTDQITVEYSLEKAASQATLTIIDAKGKKVMEKTVATQNQGANKITVNTSGLASGNYFYQIATNGGRVTKKFVVTK